MKGAVSDAEKTRESAQYGLASSQRELGALKKKYAALSEELEQLKRNGSKVETRQVPPTTPTVITSSGASLLALAKQSGNDFETAKADLTENVLQRIVKESKLSMGEVSVSKESDGTYNVIVPVTWSIPSGRVLSTINKYFNDYNGKSISLSSSRHGGTKLVKISGRYADASDSRQPYSGRLFDVLQAHEIVLEASLGSKRTRLVVAGNLDCFVSCGYSKIPKNTWGVAVNGGESIHTFSASQENPIVIKGVTEKELEQNGMPSIRFILQ
ncbi:hypothetical protein [Alteromonas sp. RKMC-009]|uniref:hypothetical protein n=1 Tax=Alteromonas sp. RKMC-009 TaxID=2267264 RepID=UPI001238637B|nr:hypothetical protein [Alteromonas sp. RKMC-009]QBX05501.2 hypothetical protein DS731_22175 [Alteromonas sp. RKMC-009]